MRYAFVSAIALGTLVAALACGPQDTFCTLIGCYSRLSLEVLDADGNPATVRTATVTSPTGSRVAIDCTRVSVSSTITGVFANVACTDTGIFAEFDADTMGRVEVALETTDGAHFEGKVNLRVVDTVFPNGPECAPICTQVEASVTAE